MLTSVLSDVWTVYSALTSTLTLTLLCNAKSVPRKARLSLMFCITAHVRANGPAPSVPGSQAGIEIHEEGLDYQGARVDYQEQGHPPTAAPWAWDRYPLKENLILVPADFACRQTMFFTRNAQVFKNLQGITYLMHACRCPPLKEKFASCKEWHTSRAAWSCRILRCMPPYPCDHGVWGDFVGANCFEQHPTVIVICRA